MGDGGSVPQLPPPLGETLPGVVQGLPEVPRGMEPQLLTVESSWKMRLLSCSSPQPSYILCTTVLVGRGVLLEQPALNGQERHASLKQDPEVCL